MTVNLLIVAVGVVLLYLAAQHLKLIPDLHSIAGTGDA